MLRLAGLVLLGVVTMASPVAAQGGYGGRRGGDGQEGRGGAARGPGYGGADPALIQAPPTPAEMTTLAHLDTVQGSRYSTIFDRFMEDTRAERDSLRLGAGSRAGQPAAGPPSSSDMQSLVRDLAHERKTFDGVLKDMLSKDQWKSYQKWLETRRKEVSARGRPAGDRPMRRRGSGRGF